LSEGTHELYGGARRVSACASGRNDTSGGNYSGPMPTARRSSSPSDSGSLALRLAEPADTTTVGDLTVRAYAEAGYLSVDDDYATELRDAESRRLGAELWVATVDGGVCATVTFCPPGSVFRELARPGEGELRMLAVDPCVRGRGLGRALVGTCLRRCAALGLDFLVLCSLEEMTPAHALYRAQGFRRDAGLDWEPAPGVRLVGFRADVAAALAEVDAS
jgi:ribosomal protein S18 acetylase RimI-like enzyme